MSLAPDQLCQVRHHFRRNIDHFNALEAYTQRLRLLLEDDVYIVEHFNVFADKTNWFSFSRERRLRVELYLDLGDKEQTKAVFDKLAGRKAELEQELPDIEWERLNNRRASRIALYHDGHILEEDNHEELRKWAAGTMVKFYNEFVDLADEAIREVKGE